MSMRNLQILIFGLLFLSTNACQQKKKVYCSFHNLKTIFHDQGNGKYIHYVLIESFDRTCLDSSKIVSIAQKYADTVRFGRPALMIKLFSTDEDFIDGEVSQPMSEIDKNCLVTITFDTTLKPSNFLFYDENGNWIHDGSTWK